MINEISVRPKPQNKNSYIAFSAFMLIAAAAVATYFIIDKYKGIVGLVAIGFLTAGVLVYTKYISPVFYYDITHDSEGYPVFVVRRIVGKRQETLARVDLADIYDAKMETRAERKKHKTPVGVLKYNYCPTMSPPSSCRVFMKSRYETSEINIEVTKEFADVLMAAAAEAKEKRLLEDDDL